MPAFGSICCKRLASSSNNAITCFKSCSFISSLRLIHPLANHPGLHMPRAATSWASCLFAVDGMKIKENCELRK
ncbi:hypothetical protein AV903_04295 [Erwinia tracheiphila]|uniref:Uncharacterized protein n=1 Tax=Erwinia tracheiphila TaxID=65700 RepID=A0A345CPY1_9GAMM|nr:hypothetical protein AV903_04295 [Erwinia tracheiphila]